MRLWPVIVAAAVGCKSPDPKVAPPPEAPADASQAMLAAQHHVETGFLLAPPIVPLPDDAIRGMAIPLYSEFPGLRYEAMVSRAEALGATHVSVVVTWDQQTIFHNRIAAHPDVSPPDDRVREVIASAHAVGLKVMLFPIVHVVQRSDGEWRGKLAPTDLVAWQRDYERFIGHYADLAAQTGVEILSVGSELSSMEKHDAFWRTLIADTRQRYAGKLVYSANWDHYQEPEFWKDLDLIGVSSYFEVARAPSDSTWSVSNRWRGERDRLLDFAAQNERPLLLTEVGYPAVTSASVRPWDYTAEGGPNLTQQLAGFRSLVDAWAGTDARFAGAFVWHGWGWGGAGDTSYNVFDKPSEDAVRAWFSSSDRHTR